MHPPVWGQHDSVLTTHLVLLAYFQANLASELHLHVSFFRSELSWSVISCSSMECPFSSCVESSVEKTLQMLKSHSVWIRATVLQFGFGAIGCGAFSPEIAFVSKDLLFAFHKWGL